MDGKHRSERRLIVARKKQIVSTIPEDVRGELLERTISNRPQQETLEWLELMTRYRTKPHRTLAAFNALVTRLKLSPETITKNIDDIGLTIDLFARKASLLNDLLSIDGYIDGFYQAFINSEIEHQEQAANRDR